MNFKFHEIVIVYCVIRSQDVSGNSSDHEVKSGVDLSIVGLFENFSRDYSTGNQALSKCFIEDCSTLRR